MPLKQPVKHQKIKKDGVPMVGGCSSDQHPFFSFRFMTTNSNYCMGFFKGTDSPECLSTIRGLYSKLEEISSKPWVHWGNLHKSVGYEMINYNQLNFGAHSEANLTKDTKLHVFRFNTYRGSGNGRIIGFKGSPCSAFHIIGYDLDFTAYDHG